MSENHYEVNSLMQIEAALVRIESRMPGKQAITTARRQEILQVVLHELETAGPAGFAAMHYFGMIGVGRHGPSPLAIRRARSVYNILEAINRSRDCYEIETTRVQLEEFKADLDEITLERIKDAGDVWLDRMRRFWASESARIRTELSVK